MPVLVPVTTAISILGLLWVRSLGAAFQQAAGRKARRGRPYPEARAALARRQEAPRVRSRAVSRGSRPADCSTRGRWEARDRRGSAGQQGRRVRPDAPTSCAAPRTVYGKLTNRSRKSEAVAASPSIGFTPKISWIVRSVELWS